MLIPEDGTGLTNADSYVSVDEADTYHNNRGNDVWQTISETVKEQLLRRATDYITYIFGPSFIGQKATTNQSLSWPRISIDDIDLYSLGVPIQVREATAELALISQTTPLLPNETSARKKSVKVGPISVEYDASSFTGPKFVSATVRLAELLGGINSAAVRTARLVRT